MNISLKCRDLFWEIEESIMNYYDCNKNNFAKINAGVEELIAGAEACLKLVQDNNLSNEEFYNLLLKFAYIDNWTTEDYYHVIALSNNIKVSSVDIIKTTMHKNNEIGINFKILSSDDFINNHEYFYSIDTIKKLIKNKKIILISEEERIIINSKDEYNPEEYVSFALSFNKDSIKKDFFTKNGKYYGFTLKYIRNSLNKKKLLELYRTHLMHTNCEIDAITNKKSWNDDNFKRLVKEYKSQYKKKDYNSRLTKLNEFRRTR